MYYNLIGTANTRHSPLKEDAAFTAQQLFGIAETPFQYQYIINGLDPVLRDKTMTFAEICGKGYAHPMSLVQPDELPYFGNSNLALPKMDLIETPKWIDPQTGDVHTEEPIYDSFDGKTYIIPKILGATYNLRVGKLVERYSRAEDANAYVLVQTRFETENGMAHRSTGDLPAVIAWSPKTRMVTREAYHLLGDLHRYEGPAQVHKVSNCSDIIVNYHRYGRNHNSFGPQMIYLLPTSNMHYKVNLAGHMMDGVGALRPTMGDQYKLVVHDFIEFLRENDISFVDFVCRMHELPELQFDFHMRFGFDPMIDVVQANFYQVLRAMEGKAYVER